MMCWFRHKWPKWSAPVLKVLIKTHAFTKGEYENHMYVQERTCGRCGLYARVVTDLEGRRA